MTIVWVILLIVAIGLLMYLRVRSKDIFWASIKPGDYVVGSGIGGYHVRELVLKKSDDRITLSESGTLSRAKFLYGGDLEYFSSEDWYSFGV